MKVKSMSREKWDKLPKMEFQNVCLDFSIKPAILKKIGSTKMKVGVESGWSKESVSYETKFAVKQGNKWWIRYSGSPCNSYVRKE